MTSTRKRQAVHAFIAINAGVVLVVFNSAPEDWQTPALAFFGIPLILGWAAWVAAR